MADDLEKVILDLLMTSSVDNAHKSQIRESLPELGITKKKKIYKILLTEQKKLFKLRKKEERLVAKYGAYMEKVTKGKK
jgi:hypothetical protein